MDKMTNHNINLSADWQAQLRAELSSEWMQQLWHFLQTEQAQGKVIYPPQEAYFNALNHTPFDKVKVVIIGQDPYHGAGQAHGLAFSVPAGVKVPPSLVNIYKELQSDVGLRIPSHGNLEEWAKQGVLLLNSVLSVEKSKAGSHQNKGWETFTDAVIANLNAHHQGIVFLLWGSYAQQKGRHIDRQQHCVLEAVHPSPLSAYRGFFGCQHFSQTNAYLQKLGKTPIDWQISEPDFCLV